MESVICIQGNNYNGTEIIVVDGIIVNNQPTKQEAYSLLIQKQVFVNDNIKNKDQNFKYLRFCELGEGKGIFIQSCVNEIDDDGRRLPFMFWCNSSSLNDAVKRLKNDIGVTDYTLSESDLDVIIKNNIQHYLKLEDSKKKSKWQIIKQHFRIFLRKTLNFWNKKLAKVKMWINHSKKS